MQALMLSALAVHTIHLERQIKGNTPIIFRANQVSEPNNNGAPSITLPIRGNTTMELLPDVQVDEDESRNNELEALSDILGNQASNDGPDPSLFGNMSEETLNKAPKTKVKNGTKTKNKS